MGLNIYVKEDKYVNSIITNIIMDLLYTMLYKIGDPLELIPNKELPRISGMMVQWISRIGFYEMLLYYQGDTANKIYLDPNNVEKRFIEHMHNTDYGVTVWKHHENLTEKDYLDDKAKGSLDGFGFLPWTTKIIPSNTHKGIYYALVYTKDYDSKNINKIIEPNNWVGYPLKQRLKTIGFFFIIFIIGKILLRKII